MSLSAILILNWLTTTVLMDAQTLREQSVLSEPTLGGQFQSARSLAMGNAQRAIAVFSDAVLMNPAAMSLSKSYALEAGYAWSQAPNAHRMNLSVIDSDTTVVAAGVAYQFERRIKAQNLDVHRLSFAASYAYKFFYVGVTMRYMEANRAEAVPEEIKTELPVPPANTPYRSYINGDVGILLKPIQYLSLAAVGYNLVYNKKNQELSPIALGLGAAAHIKSLTVAFDALLDFQSLGKTAPRYHLGGEYTIAKMIPLRAGFIADRLGDDYFWSVGTGFQYKWAHLAAGFRQAVKQPTNRTLSFSFAVKL